MANNGSKYNLTGVVKDTSGFNSKDITPKTVTTTEVNTKRLNVDEEAVINDLTANSVSASQVIVNGLFKTTARSTIDINGLTSINNTVYVLTMTQFESELVKAAVNGGTSIVVAPGEFIVSSPLTVPANTDIRGSGMNTTVFKARSGFGSSNPMFNFTGSNSSMSDLQLNGNAGTVTLLKQTSVNFVFLDKLKFTNTSGTMLELDSATKSNITNILFRTKPSSAYSALYVYGDTQDCIFSNLYFIDIDENTTNESGAAIYLKPNGDSATDTGTGIIRNIHFSRVQIVNSDLTSSFRYRLISLNADGDSSSLISKIQISSLYITGVVVESSFRDGSGGVADDGGSLILLHKTSNASINNILITELDVSDVTISSGNFSGSIILISNSSGNLGGRITNIRIEGVKVIDCDNLTHVILSGTEIPRFVVDSVIYETVYRTNTIAYISAVGYLSWNGPDTASELALSITNVVTKNFPIVYILSAGRVIISNCNFTGVCELGSIIGVDQVFGSVFINSVIISYDSSDSDYTAISTGSTIVVTTSIDVFLSNIHMKDVSRRGILMAAIYSHIDNCIIEVVDDPTINDYVIDISGFSNSIPIVNSITNCKIIGQPKSGNSVGIRAVPVHQHNVLISGNYIEGCDTGIYFEGQTAFASASYINRHVTIEGNIILDHIDGILVEDPSRAVVRGNIINTPASGTGTGISLSHRNTSVVDNGDIAITENVVQEHTTGLSIAYSISGIYFHGIVNNNRITDNTTNLAISHHASNTNSELVVRDNNTVRSVTAATATVSIAQLDDRVYLDTTSNAIAITLSDLELSYMGMRVTFYFQTRPGANNVTITPGTTGVDIPGLAAYTTNVVMNAAGQQVVFEWTGSAWDLRGYSAAVVVT